MISRNQLAQMLHAAADVNALPILSHPDERLVTHWRNRAERQSELMWSLLSEAWSEGNLSGAEGYFETHNPYREQS